MQIIATPPKYSPAYADAIFQIEAPKNEKITLDIYNNDNSQIIGRKKISGATQYDINIANYAKRQFEISPIISDTTQFVIPSKRTINIKIGTPVGNASATLSAGIYYPELNTLLSDCPTEKVIRYDESDEIPFRTKNGTLSAQITIYGKNKEDSLVLTTKEVSEGMVVLTLNMPDINQTLTDKSIGDITEYNRMELRIMANAEQIITIQYKLIHRSKENTRICWWNPYGHIDFYTMQNISQKNIRNFKTKIYSSNGYIPVENYSETELAMNSQFENYNTMEWLSQLVSSPKAWIYDNGIFIPIDITTNNIVTKSEQLTMMNITARETQKKYYPTI